MNHDTMTLQEHLAEFKEQGYTIFPKVFDDALMQRWKDKLASMEAEGLEGLPHLTFWFQDMCERAPTLMMPAVANPVILDFAEMVLGPFVQLDNQTLAGIPSSKPEDVKSPVSGYHRDRWAQVPVGSDYQHPLAINSLCYLNGLNAESGPLRVIPGSHRRPLTLTPEEQKRPHPDEIALNVEAGDVVVTHNCVLHSGSPNLSGKTRYLFSTFYNKTWLRPTDNHHGPNIRALVRDARAINDLRTLRLFGEDDNLASRANSQFIRADEEVWNQWAAADKAALKTPNAKPGA